MKSQKTQNGHTILNKSKVRELRLPDLGTSYDAMGIKIVGSGKRIDKQLQKRDSRNRPTQIYQLILDNGKKSLSFNKWC